MKVLISGGDGFIGKNLVKRLAEMNHDVIVIDNNITSFQNNASFPNVTHFIEAIEDFDIGKVKDIDLIFHLASVASPLVYKNDFNNVFGPNVLGTRNLIKLAMRDRALLVYSSTSEVYGTLDPSVQTSGISEQSTAIVHLLTDRSIYACSKRMGEELVFNYIKQGFNGCILRLFNVYGYDMDLKNEGYGRVIPNFVDAIYKGQSVQIFGDGKQVRSFMWIDDLIDALVKIINSKRPLPPVMNIGNDEPCQIIDLEQKISKLFNKKTKVCFLPKDKDDPSWRRPNCKLIKDELGWEPKMTLQQGLSLLVRRGKK